MKLIKKGSYKKTNVKTGLLATMFVYEVLGTLSEIQALKDAQGDNYREDPETGKTLFFTSRAVLNGTELIITTNGRVVPNTSELDEAASIAAQYGGNLGEKLAEGFAARAMQRLDSAQVSTTTVAASTDDTDDTTAPTAEELAKIQAETEAKAKAEANAAGIAEM